MKNQDNFPNQGREKKKKKSNCAKHQFDMEL